MVVDALVSTFGPFLIPVALFLLGLVGYLLLLAARRYWDGRGAVTDEYQPR